MSSTIDPRAEIGHVHLKVADLDRALAFYRDVLGFSVTGRIGDQLAFLAAGGYHHHIGLNTLESRGGTPPAAGTTGLYHAAIRYPPRPAPRAPPPPPPARPASTTPRSATRPARRSPRRCGRSAPATIPSATAQ